MWRSPPQHAGVHPRPTPPASSHSCEASYLLHIPLANLHTPTGMYLLGDIHLQRLRSATHILAPPPLPRFPTPIPSFAIRRPLISKPANQPPPSCGLLYDHPCLGRDGATLSLELPLPLSWFFFFWTLTLFCFWGLPLRSWLASMKFLGILDPLVRLLVGRERDESGNVICRRLADPPSSTGALGIV